MNTKTKVYVAGNHKYHLTIIHAIDELDCQNVYAESKGYVNYADMLKQLGKDIAKVECSVLYELN